MNFANAPMRNLIILLVVLAGILSCAIFVAAKSTGRSRAEAALTEAKNQTEEAQKDAAQKDAAERLESLEKDIADLKKQLEAKQAEIDERATKLAAAEKLAVNLRGQLDAALKNLAELSHNYAADLKKAEDSAAEARDAARRAELAAEDAKKEVVTAAKAADPPVIANGNKKPGRKNGKIGAGANARRGGPVALLPRSTPSFSDLDTDHDGRLSLAEYKAGYPDATDAEQDFKSLDTNGDGWLSIDEYKAGHPDPPLVHTKRAKKN
jgi:peptidoglycan hydrolase CwlO-like protein